MIANSFRTWAHLTYHRFLDFRGSYYARSGLLDHLSSDGFDYWSDGLFHAPRSFLHWRTFGLGLGNRSRSQLSNASYQQIVA